MECYVLALKSSFFEDKPHRCRGVEASRWMARQAVGGVRKRLLRPPRVGCAVHLLSGHCILAMADSAYQMLMRAVKSGPDLCESEVLNRSNHPLGKRG